MRGKMELKYLGRAFLVMLMISMLSMVYADTGPNIDANQAKAIAQDYLNSHNLPYTALTPNINSNWQAQVKVKETGEIMWVPFGQYKSDAMEGTAKYQLINTAWIVQVQDKNGNNKGNIYINPDSGSIISVNVEGADSGTNNEGYNGNNNKNNKNQDNTSTQQGGFMEILQNIYNDIIAFFQQIWVMIFRGQ